MADFITPHSKKSLGFAPLRSLISKHFLHIADTRQLAKTRFPLHDCLMSAFAMMYFQDPSLLEFQHRLQNSSERNNLKTIFGVERLPQATQLRASLDDVPPQSLYPLFSQIVSRLQRGKQLQPYQCLKGHYLVTIDGTEIFSSDTIHCRQCLRQKRTKGPVRYHHQVLQAAIMHPQMRQVIALAPEFIGNQDGSVKQDCEINAAKRLVAAIRQRHPKLRIIINADGLYSKQPFIDTLHQHELSYILVAKPSDHKELFQWVDEILKLNQGGRHEWVDQKKRRHLYQWVAQVPVNATANARQVNFFQYEMSAGGKLAYRNSWITDQQVSAENILELVNAARCRWKIENETFNTLKNLGYHVEHNFGHGERNLCSVFYLLNLLAFAIHQVLELTDRLYQQCRAQFGSRREYWGQLRYTIRIVHFKSFDHLLSFLIAAPEIRAP